MRKRENIFFVIVSVILVLGSLFSFYVMSKDENIEFASGHATASVDKSDSNMAMASPDLTHFFLSEVIFKNNTYSPKILDCLFDQDSAPLYAEWSGIYYPSKPPYAVSLIKVKFQKQTKLPNDCFIKELRSDSDWQDVQSKYGFNMGVFGG